MKFGDKLKEPIILFIVLNTFDAILSYIALNGESINYELNPIYRILFPMVGVGLSLLLLKIVGIVAMSFIYYTLINDKNRPILRKALKYINFVYILIVLNNLYWVYRNVYIH